LVINIQSIHDARSEKRQNFTADVMLPTFEVVYRSFGTAFYTDIEDTSSPRRMTP